MRMFQANRNHIWLALLLLTTSLNSHSGVMKKHADLTTRTLTLGHVLEVVKANDFELMRLNFVSEAYQYESEAASELPDPTVFAAIQNLPTDSFEFDQEPMTQLRVGIRQMFPKGQTRALKSELAKLTSEMQEPKQALRWIELKKETEHTWIEAWYWQTALTLLEEDEVFLRQVSDFIQSLYEVGAKDQSDLLGAKLELVKLEDQRINAQRMLEMQISKLEALANQGFTVSRVAPQLPNLLGGSEVSQDVGFDQFVAHPSVTILDRKIALSEKHLQLSYEDLKPSWGLEASYGLRSGKNMDGSDRPDFFSVGLNIQLPLFSDAKQRQTSLGEKSRINAVEVQKDQTINALAFNYKNQVTQLTQIRAQEDLYEERLLPTLAKQKNSAIQAYEADQGSFGQVVNLFLKEQDAKLKLQGLKANEARIASEISYLLANDEENE